MLKNLPIMLLRNTHYSQNYAIVVSLFLNQTIFIDVLALTSLLFFQLAAILEYFSSQTHLELFYYSIHTQLLYYFLTP